ncbi:MAG: DUF4442 domain-containing protein [Gammaproteobacteria bacterium]|nr:DUF4442 domain-containing protein [Gammaproteobacteria bacterium]
MNWQDTLTQSALNLFRSLDDTRQGLLPALRREAGYRVLNGLLGRVIPFTARNGLRITALRPGFIEAQLALRGNHNHFGSMYAGALFMLAEIPGGAITLLDLGERTYPILREMQMTYLQPARSDVHIRFTLSDAERQRLVDALRKQDRVEFSLNGELYDAEDRLVARSHAVYQLRRKA